MNGENFDPLHWSVSEYAALIQRAVTDGVQVVRLVVRRDQMDRRRFCELARASGLQVVGVLDRDAIGTDGGAWPRRIAEVRDAYSDIVDVWQPMNEPDGADSASWQLGPDTVSAGLRVARAALGPNAIIAGPGLTNSKPWYLENIDYRPCDFVSAHLYGRHVRIPRFAHSFGSPVEIIERYATIGGRPVMVSEWGYLEDELAGEWGSQTRAMADFLANDPRVSYGIHFCADSVMVAGFGAYDHGQPTRAGDALASAYVAARARERKPSPRTSADTSARPADASHADLETNQPGGSMATSDLDKKIDEKKAKVGAAIGREYKRKTMNGTRIAFTDAGLIVAEPGVPGAYLLEDGPKA